MSSPQLTDGELPTARQTPELRVLSVKSSMITDSGVAALARDFKRLRYLHLYGCKRVTRQCLSSLEKFQDLQYLHIGDTPLEQALYNPQIDSVPTLQRRLPKCLIDIGS